MKRIALFIICASITTIMCSTGLVPIRNVVCHNNEIIVSYHFKGVNLRHDPLSLGAKIISIPGFGVINNIGKPAVPFRSDCISLPKGASYEISVIETQYMDSALVLSPARQPLFDSDTTEYSQSNVLPIQSYTGFYPQHIVGEVNLSTYQDYNLLRVNICPVQYDVENHVARIFSFIKYKISYNPSGLLKREKIVGSRTKETFLDRITINHGIFSDSEKKTTETKTNTTSERDDQFYLIITTDNYLSAIKDFVEWKRIKGKRVVVQSKNSWNSFQEVKDSISSLYADVGEALNYLLIIGGISDVPTYNSELNRTHVTDLHYACMGGINDYVPEFHHGRILVNSAFEASNVLNKIVQYEKAPVNDSQFYRKAMHVAEFNTTDREKDMEQRRFTLTSEEILNYVQRMGIKVSRSYYARTDSDPKYWNNGWFYHGGQIPDSLRKPQFAWDGNAAEMNNNINNGCLYVLKRGHAATDYWSSPYYYNHSIALLQNKNKYPVVFSICCSSGNFGGPQMCFAEAFLKSANAGCVGIIAATRESYSGLNDIFAETMFDAIWPDTILRIKMPDNNDERPRLSHPVYELGAIMDDGLSYMEDVGWNGGLGDSINNLRTLYTREIYHCFGDPSMMMYTNEPTSLGTPIINYKNGKLCVQSPCDSTRISFYSPSSISPVVDSYIGDYVEYATNADSVIICIDKHNYIPFVQTYHKNIFLQNDTITDDRYLLGDSIIIGRNVTSQKPVGDVIINNANLSLQGGTIRLDRGTFITNSRVSINQR